MLARINECLSQLSRAEQQVARTVLATPDRVIHENVAALAGRSGVSEPTVIRFCRSVGADGFRALKLELARSIERDEPVIHADIGGDESMPDLIDKVVGRAILDLGRLRSSVDPAAVTAAADLLATAATVEFWGMGASGLVAADAQNKFFRLRLPCLSYSDVPTLLQSAAIRSNNDVIVAISNSGRSDLLNQACATARGNGAAVIAITAAQTPLSRIADVTLHVDVEVDDGRYTPRSSRLAHLLTIDILQVATAIQLGAAAVSHLRATKSALKTLDRGRSEGID